MEDKEYYTHEEMLDVVLGEIGTPERDEYESKMKSFQMGEAIRQARLSKHLTQEELGEKLGVKRARVSRMEKGENLTVSTVSRAFKAMDISAVVYVPGVGRVNL